MARLSIGLDVRQAFIEAGDKGLVIADLFSDWRRWKTHATYNSFARYCWLLKKLGFIEPTTKTEVAWSATGWGENPKLHDRTYFRITPEGKSALDRDWSNPMRTFYNRVYGSDEAWTNYIREWKRSHPYKPTGKPRGRPPKVKWSE
jgi:hypothetical protein